MQIETERLILRRFCKSDLQDLYEYLSDEEVVRFEPCKPMDWQEVENTLNWRMTTEEMLAVELKASGKMIGNVYLGQRDFEARELGFVFNRQYWGQGYARESCKALMQHAFATGAAPYLWGMRSGECPFLETAGEAGLSSGRLSSGECVFLEG